MSEPEFVARAVSIATFSPCAKSKRGAVVYRKFADGRSSLSGMGFNGPPEGFACDGSRACRAACGKICLHAEQRALENAYAAITLTTFLEPEPLPSWTLELVHVKVVDGKLVAGGGPSCWQCSRLAVERGAAVWLYELPAGDLTGHDLRDVVGHWRRYEPAEFHRLTLEHEENSLPVIVAP